MKKENIFRHSLCLVLCLILLISVLPLPSRAVDDTWINNAAKALRDTMVAREDEINFTYESDSWIFSPEAFGNTPEAEAILQQEISPLLDKIYRQAIAHTGVGNEGDYLRWHLKSCEESFSYGYIQDGDQAKDFVYSFKFALTYYTTKAQEDAVTAKVQQVLSQLNLAGKTDYEKVKAIYDYLCANVVYDNANLNNQSYDLKFTAYAALINGTSVCQGYSNLLYRMALEAGVDCRFIFGQSRGGNHSWNIVKLDGVYYNLDATWDAVTKDYSFFLKTDAHMTDHTKDPEYIEPAFLAVYPLASGDYTIPGNTGNTGNTGSTGNTGNTGNIGNTGNSGSQQPETNPTVPEEQEPPTEPATQPETQPATQPETEPATQPSTEAPTQPATQPATQPSVTQPAVQPSGPVAAPSTGETAPETAPTQPNTSSGDGTSTKTWLTAAVVVTVVAVAAVLAAVTAKRRK